MLGTSKSKENPASIVLLPCVQATYGHLSRMLVKHIKSVGLLPRMISSYFHPVKDDRELRAIGVYNICCECI